MQKILLSTSLLLLGGGQAFPSELHGPNSEVGRFVEMLWRVGPGERVTAFDGKELPQQPVPEGEVPRQPTFEMLVCGGRRDEDPQQEGDPFLPNPHRAEPGEIPEIHAAQSERKFDPGFVASDPFGMFVFAIGLLGWTGLGIAVVIVERKR